MDEENPVLRAGTSVKCRVCTPEPGGYAVKLVPSGIDGFLPCQEELNEGQVVPATFVCMSKDQALMTFAFRIGTTERVQMGLPSEPETAFAVWADSHPRTYKLRRAIDIVMPPVSTTSLSPLRSGDYDIGKLITDLEEGALTGCVKMICDERLSRGALLLFRGRAVGCIYGKKPMVEPYPIESAIQMLLLDSFLPETKITIYDLPDEVILSMSAMFLGVPVLEKDFADKKNLASLVKPLKDDTAILTATAANEMCLAFLHEGEVFGSFHVDEQRFSDQGETFDTVLNKATDSTVEISILPHEMTTDKVLFGYGLSSTLEVMKGQAPIEM
ncbi:MAG TPA: hypothetical protein PKZ32_16965, partial [Candidatus Melainabacteria bacterium]|jgi:hypothetical protein|nr:hypothetical protein [Candidatus Melainabacteria bacterium]